MNKEKLADVAKRMVVKPRGILAMDESTSTMSKRLEGVGVEVTEENRRLYRQMLVTTKDLGKYISGAIMFEETLFQKTDEGKDFVDCLKDEDIIPGIKVDLGLEEFGSGENATMGLDGLGERLEKYKAQGAEFAKWRAVIHIDVEKGLPTKEAIAENAERLAEYALACQEHGIVPIVEPEVLMEGTHSIDDCEKVSTDTLKVVFSKLSEHGVHLPGIVLKPNMVVPGNKNAVADPAIVAEKTVKVLTECIPAEVPGIAFLSGGIGDEDVTNYLNAMNKNHPGTPWNLTFSFGRGLQREPLAYWAKNQDDVPGAQNSLMERSKASSDATVGKHA